MPDADAAAAAATLDVDADSDADADAGPYANDDANDDPFGYHWAFTC